MQAAREACLGPTGVPDEIGGALLKAVGLYPPGSFVELACGEIGPYETSLYIDARDVLYVADSESRAPQGYGHHPGWTRGIRVGSARDGRVTAFIPDTAPDPETEERIVSQQLRIGLSYSHLWHHCSLLVLFRSF